MRIPADRERMGFEPQRFLSRSTVIEHLDVLERAGFVRRIGEEHVADQQGMVAFIEDVSDLAKLRAVIEVDVESTHAARPQPGLELPAPPRLVIVGGTEAGRAFGLGSSGPWELGRAPACDVALTHDPHVSRSHVSISRTQGGHVARVVDAAKNPVWVDFARVDPGSSVVLRPGSILTVGATTLVLQS